MNAVALIAHAPLATALCRAAAHILPVPARDLVAVDVDAALTLDVNRERAQEALQAVAGASGVLLLADVLGATPCNIATGLARELGNARLLAGVNLPMLLRALTYRCEPLDVLLQRARDGGAAGVVTVPATADPQTEEGQHGA